MLSIKREKIAKTLAKEPGLCAGILLDEFSSVGSIGCFIGALLSHSSFPKHLLPYVSGGLCVQSCQEVKTREATKLAREVLEKEYGLSEQAIEAGITLNDTLRTLDLFDDYFDQGEISPQERLEIVVAVVESGLFDEIVEAYAT